MIQVYVGSDPEVFVWYGMRYEQVCVRYDPSECEVIDPSVCVVLVTRGLILKINPN